MNPFKSKTTTHRSASILVVHGIDTKCIGYSDALRKRVRKKLGTRIANRLYWGEVFWADVTRNNQRDFLDDAMDTCDLKFGPARRRVVQGLGDAAAYQKTTSKAQTGYQQIQEKVDAALRQISPMESEGDDRPLLIVAHSLGGHIASTFIYDRLYGSNKWAPPPDRHDEFPPNKVAFMNLNTLSGVVTFGCNIPLFTFAYKAPDVRPIELPDYARRRFDIPREWRNFFARTDVLGFPLRPLSDLYWETVWTDRKLYGGWKPYLTPLSHNAYWKDGTVVSQIAEMAGRLVTTSDVKMEDSSSSINRPESKI